MNPRIVLSFFVLLCIAIAIAGCTGAPAEPVPAATAAEPGVVSSPAAASGAALIPTENESPGEGRNVKVNIEKDHLGMIHATFQGGPGLIHVRKIVVTVNRSDGEVRTAEVGITLDDSATIEGTKATDRVMVHVTFSDGKTYKIYDELVPFKVR